MKRNRLDRVLRVREVEEDVARGAWALAEQEAARARETTGALLAAHRAAEVELTQRLACGRLAPTATLYAHRAIEQIGREITQARALERSAAARAETARAPWELKRREKRGLEILVERARLLRLEEARRVETASLDEAASQRAARARRMPDAERNPS